MAEVSGGAISSIEEKPKQPKSNYAVTGIYMYDATVFDKIKILVPSHRGELEITDVNNAYVREGSMTFSFLDGWWTDAGTFDSLLRAARTWWRNHATGRRRRMGPRSRPSPPPERPPANVHAHCYRNPWPAAGRAG